MAKQSSKLNLKQQQFIDEYLSSGDHEAVIYRRVYDCKESSAIANASRLLNNDKIQGYIQGKNRRHIRRGAYAAINKLVELIDSEDENVAFKSAKEVKDMDGYKPKEQIDLTQKGDLNIMLTLPEDLDFDDII
jgi:phage terminase small subunit